MTLTGEDPYRGLVSLQDRLARLLDEPGWYPVVSRGARSAGVWVPELKLSLERLRSVRRYRPEKGFQKWIKTVSWESWSSSSNTSDRV